MHGRNNRIKKSAFLNTGIKMNFKHALSAVGLSVSGDGLLLRMKPRDKESLEILYAGSFSLHAANYTSKPLLLIPADR